MKDINDNGVNFMTILKSLTPQQIFEKQKHIARIAPTLQYSIIPPRIAEQPGAKPGDYTGNKGLDVKLSITYSLYVKVLEQQKKSWL
jgi:hypothetical protein